jgi:hypothetical protein
MIPSRIRILLALVFAGLAAYAWSGAAGDQQTLGLVLTLMAALMVWGWLRYADVPRAARAFTNQDRTRAWSLLDKTPFGGRWLAPALRVYYHHVRTLCLLHWDRWDEAAREAEAGLRVPSIGDRAPALHASAAEAYAYLGDRAAAERHVTAAKSQPCNAAVVNVLGRVERTLKSA